MNARRTRRTWWLPMVAMLAMLAAAVLGAAATPGPSALALVQSTSQRVIATLNARRASFSADPSALRAYVRGELDTVFDRDYAARLVLGRYGRTASETDVRDFADALGDNLMVRYGSSLLAMDAGLRVSVIGQESFRDGTLIKVHSRIERRTGAPVAVDYLLHQHDGRWQVFDVIVEGVSFVQTFRAQFDEQLRNRSLAQVTADLRAQRLSAHATAAPPAAPASPSHGGRHR